MFKNVHPPPSFTFLEKGKTSFLLKEEYLNLLLKQGIDDLKTFLKKSSQASHYVKGRTLHPSLPLEGEKRMVLRQYSHGGMLSPLTGNLYLFGARSFQELALTEEIRSCGISTVSPLGAIHHRIFFPFYQAYFLSLEVPRAIDLIQFFQEMVVMPSSETLSLKRKTIQSAGLLVRQFHQAGFIHGDLQLKNILVAGDQLFLIDFDRSYRKPILSIQERLKNLFRLNRSVEKWKRLGVPITRTDRWRFFTAYTGGDKKIQEAMKRSLRTYSLLFLFHRLGWTLQKIVGS